MCGVAVEDSVCHTAEALVTKEQGGGSQKQAWLSDPGMKLWLGKEVTHRSKIIDSFSKRCNILKNLWGPSDIEC